MAGDRKPRVMSWTLDSVGKLGPVGSGLRPGRFIRYDEDDAEEWLLPGVRASSSRSW